MTKVLGIDVPTSTMPPRRSGEPWRYSSQPLRMDSWGINEDWPSPTALSFEVKTMNSERVRFMGRMLNGPVSPDGLLFLMERTLTESVHKLAWLLKDRDMVSDRSGLQSSIEPGQVGTLNIRTEVIAWPAVPGVTTHYADSTI